MYKKLFLLMILLCGDSVLLGMEIQKYDVGHFVKLDGDCVNRIFQYLSFVDFVRLSSINKESYETITTQLSDIISNDNFNACREMKKDHLLRTKALMGYAKRFCDNDKIDWHSIEGRIFEQLQTRDGVIDFPFVDRRMNHRMPLSKLEKVILYAGCPYKMKNDFVLQSYGIANNEYDWQKTVYAVIKNAMCHSLPAVNNFHLEVVKNIVKNNSLNLLQSQDLAFLNILNTSDNDLPLMIFSSLGHEKVDKYGDTVLYALCANHNADHSRIDVIKGLLENGVKVDVRSWRLVCSKRDASLVELFVEYDADLNCHLGNFYFNGTVLEYIKLYPQTFAAALSKRSFYEKYKDSIQKIAAVIGVGIVGSVIYGFVSQK